MTISVNDLTEKSGRRAWSLREILAWTIIAVSILSLLALSNGIRKSKKVAEPEEPDLRLLLPSRYLVGVKNAFPAAMMKDQDLGKSLDRSAKTSADKLDVGIVRGELEGKDAALRDIAVAAAEDPALKKDAALLRGVYAGENPEPAEEWNDFKRRHGWFADLAKSYGKPPTDPLRQATTSAAVRTMVFGVGSIILLGISGVAGLALLVTGIVLWAMGKIQPAFGRTRALPADRSSHIEAVAMYLSIYIMGSLAFYIAVHFIPQISTRWAIVMLPLGFLTAVLWPRARGETWAEWRAAVGLHTGKGVFRELGCGVLGYVAGLPVMGIGFLLTALLIKLTGADPSHPITREITTDPKRVAELLLLASVWAPITEELMFRGSLFAHLRERWGWWASALMVSLVFAIIHPQGLAAIPVLGSLALVFAGIREWRGSILGCMMAHALNNTMVLLSVVLMMA